MEFVFSPGAETLGRGRRAPSRTSSPTVVSSSSTPPYFSPGVPFGGASTAFRFSPGSGSAARPAAPVGGERAGGGVPAPPWTSGAPFWPAGEPTTAPAQFVEQPPSASSSSPFSPGLPFGAAFSPGAATPPGSRSARASSSRGRRASAGDTADAALDAAVAGLQLGGQGGSVEKSAAAQAQAEELRDAATRAYRAASYTRALQLYGQALLAAETAAWCPSERATLLSNRAAARLSAAGGALDCAAAVTAAHNDCLKALQLQPGHARATARLATCHLRLGRYADAARLAQDTGADVERFTAHAQGHLRASLSALAAAGVELWAEASRVLEEAPPAQQGSSPCAGSDAQSSQAQQALDAADAVLLHAPLCVTASRARCEALLLLRRPKDAATAASASAAAALSAAMAAHSPAGGGYDWWAAWTSARVSLATGDVDAAAAALTQLGHLPAAASDALAALSAASGARERGNALFKGGSWAEAADAYGEGLGAWARRAGGLSLSCAAPQLATLLCNRAAALHKLGWRLEACADCGAALLLVPAHAKALSRRAALHAELRMHAEALADLKQLQLAAHAEYPPADCARRVREAQAACGQLPAQPPELYGSLGLAAPASTAAVAALASEARKAYRRAALRLHPDKAGHALPLGAFAGLEDALRCDAERLFRLASDAHSRLCDPTARETYDAEEAARRRRASYGHGQAHQYQRPAPRNPYGRQPHSYHDYPFRSGSFDYDEEDEEDEDDFYLWRQAQFQAAQQRQQAGQRGRGRRY